MDRWLDFRHRRLIVAATEAGFAAGFAWFVARWMLSSQAPLYAPIAAVVVIGAGYVRRIERAKAMLSGMALAIATSEIGVRTLGTGPIQIGVLTAVAVLLAHVVFDDLLAVVYAGLNAAVLVALGGDGWIPERALEAIVGAGTAYTLVYLILPPRPEGWIREAITDQISIAGENLSNVASALRSADTDAAMRASDDSDQIDGNVDSLADTLDFSHEVSRYSPWRRRRRPQVEQLIGRTEALQKVLRYTTTLVRIAGRLAASLSSSEDVLADAIDSESEAIASMGKLIAGQDDRTVRERLDEIEALNQEAMSLSEGVDDGHGLHIAAVAALRIVAEETRAWVERVEQDLEESRRADGYPSGRSDGTRR